MVTQNRFQDTVRFLHFADSTLAGGDFLAKIQPLISLLVQNFKKLTPGAVTVIDEIMVPFRGQLIFKQYIPGKSSQYGVKLFKLCDSKGYTCDLTVYGN